MARRASAEVAGGALRLRGAGIEVAVSLADGAIALSDGERWRPLPSARAGVELEDGSLLSASAWEVSSAPERFQDVQGEGVRATTRSHVAAIVLHLELAVYDATAGAFLRLGLENVGTSPVRVRTLTPLAASRPRGGGLALASRPAAWRFFRQGWQSWTPAAALSGAQQDIDARPPVHAPQDVPPGRGNFASEEVAALLDSATGQTMLLGFVSARRQWAQVCLRAGDRGIEANAHADGATVAPGETMWSERLYVDFASDGPAGFERYADALAREMGARVPGTTPSGWCSWYYYFTTVTEEDVRRNLRFLQERRDALPLDYVQIDDGYQAGIGDWTETNEKFPAGMGRLAREIKDAGFKPGIWLAPFIVGEESRLFAQHPGWLVRDANGGPALALRNWDQACYGLDCTHPEVDAWLRALFGEITDGWGYDYVKIDFLYGGAIAGRRHDGSASRIEAYRRGLAAVREAVGERFVLGCGALMGASVGLVDGQRIGPDVAPWWQFARRTERRAGRPQLGGEPSTENALRNTLTRAWMHGRLWANDPDCLLARSTRTKLTLPEAQSMATAIALSGGMTLLSDDMTQLSKERLDLVALLLPPLGRAAAVVDLLESSMPSHMELRVSRDFDDCVLIGRFNWQGRRRSLRTPLPPGRWCVYELWEGRYHGELEGEVMLGDVPAHGARLLALRPVAEQPHLVATTFHASMGCREVVGARFDERGNTLRLDLGPAGRRRGEVVVRAAGQRLREVRAGGEALEWKAGPPGVVSVQLALTGPASVTFRFD